MRKLLVPVLAVIVTLGSAASGYWIYQARTSTVPESVTAAGPATSPQQQFSPIGTRRPDFSLPDLQGRMRHINEWDGDVIAINFWATWCPPCLREIPAFVALQEKYADQGLQFIGIALHKAEEVTGFVEQYGMNYPVLVGEMAVISLAGSLGNEAGALPYTVVIDRDQHITYVQHGELPADKAEAVIIPLL